MPRTRAGFGHRKRVRRRSFLVWSAVSFLPPIFARAQQRTRVIGFLGGAIPPANAPKTPFIAALERRLNETGYVSWRKPQDRVPGIGRRSGQRQGRGHYRRERGIGASSAQRHRDHPDRLHVGR